MSYSVQILSKSVLAEPGSSDNNHSPESQELTEVLVDVPIKTSTKNAEESVQILSKSVLAEPGSSYNNHSPELQELVEVLVDVPIKTSTDNAEEEEKLFTYKIPPNLDIQPGDIVIVPFGKQQVGAIAIRKTSKLPEGLSSDRLKNISDIITKSFFPATYWQLLEKVAIYYQTHHLLK